MGVCHAQLMHGLSVYVANVRRGEAGCTHGTPLSAVKTAARNIANEGTVTLFQKCELRTPSGRVTYWAVPEFRHHDDHVRARYDFVEEWAELWAWSDTRKPCRPAVQLRGFVHVQLEGEETYSVAIARNLQPHDDAVIDDAGNPRHPFFTVLHCLWKLQRSVLAACIAGCWLLATLRACVWFWFQTFGWGFLFTCMGRPQTHDHKLRGGGTRQCKHISQYLMPCEDIGWRLAIQIDHGFSKTSRRTCEALMETGQECFVSSATDHARANDPQGSSDSDTGSGGEHASDNA